MKIKYIFISAIIAATTSISCNSSNHKHEDNNKSTTSHNHSESCDHEHEEENHSEHEHDENESCDHNHEAHEEHNHDDHSGHNHDEDSHSDEIIITPEKAKNLGIKSKKIQPKSFNKVLKTSGQIMTAQGDEKTIVASVSGVVNFNTSVFNEGNSVKAGESILRISNDKIADGDPFIKAKASFETAEKEYNRNQELAKDKIVSQKELDLSYERYITAKTSYQALSKQRVGSQTSVSAPINGFIKTLFVKDGEYVSVGQPLAIVSQNKRLRLRAEVSEKHFSQLASVCGANFRPSYENNTYSLSELNGKLISYGKSSTDNTVYIPVIFEFDNNGTIVPGAFTEVFLLSSPIENAITVPFNALIEEQGSFFVFNKVDAEGYVKKEVKIGANDGKNVMILSGINSGDVIVTEGAYQVKLASTSSAIPHGHEH